MNPIEPGPIWNPDDHLDRVYRRGRQLRRRQLAGAAAAGTVLLVTVIALGFGPLTKGDKGRRVLTAGTSAPTTTTTTTLAPAGTATTNTPGTSTSVKPAVVTSGPPTPTSVTTPGGCLSFTTATDKTRYGLSQPISISLVVRNPSSQPCTAFGPSGIGPYAAVLASSGTEVWRSNPIAIACTNPCPRAPVLAPGQSVSYPAGQWTAGSATAGNFQAVAHRIGVTAAPADFTVG